MLQLFEESKSQSKRALKNEKKQREEKESKKILGNEDDVEAVVSDTYTSPKAQAKVMLEKVIAPLKGKTKKKERTKRRKKKKGGARLKGQ